jgi:hypothetical protein
MISTRLHDVSYKNTATSIWAAEKSEIFCTKFSEHFILPVPKFVQAYITEFGNRTVYE